MSDNRAGKKDAKKAKAKGGGAAKSGGGGGSFQGKSPGEVKEGYVGFLPIH